MLAIAIIWCVIGALFGVPRALARYRNEIVGAQEHRHTLTWREYAFAMSEALIELTKWTLLGVFSGISYLAWILLHLALANQKELEKPDTLGALGFSILIFVLGALALQKPRVK